MIDNIRPIKLLCSSRDPAAAHAMINILGQAKVDSRFSVAVIASAPASEIFERSGWKTIPLLVTAPSDLLTKELEGILEQFRPDVIIAGSSGPDAGIDEYLVKLAALLEIRSYVVQDFWGDVNLSLDVPADCYFVVDKFAEELTIERVNSETYITGSVKHASYGTFNLPEARALKRSTFGVCKSKLLVGYFGMPLGNLQGYWRTLDKLIDKLLDIPIYLVYRPHPKEDEYTRARTREMMGVVDNFIEDSGDCVEETLAACDLILSCYSSCGIDSELLGRGYREDDRLSIFLLFDSEIREYYQSYTRLLDIPTSIQQRTLTVANSLSLEKTLDIFSSVVARRKFLKSAPGIPLASQSASLILDKIYFDYPSKTKMLLRDS